MTSRWSLGVRHKMSCFRAQNYLWWKFLKLVVVLIEVFCVVQFLSTNSRDFCCQNNTRDFRFSMVLWSFRSATRFVHIPLCITRKKEAVGLIFIAIRSKEESGEEVEAISYYHHYVLAWKYFRCSYWNSWFLFKFASYSLEENLKSLVQHASVNRFTLLKLNRVLPSDRKRYMSWQECIQYFHSRQYRLLNISRYFFLENMQMKNRISKAASSKRYDVRYDTIH